VDPAKLVAPVEHSSRLFMIEAGTLTVWYLGLDKIHGPAQPIYLQPLTKHGGEAIALGSNGSSLYVITSHGELIKFDGVSPANATAWSHAATVRVAPPAGRKAFVRIGLDMGVLTTVGLLPVSAEFETPESGAEGKALTRAILPLYEAALPVHAIDSRAQNLTLLDCGQGLQLIRDGETGGWSRWHSVPATCWLETAAGLHFGRTDGAVCRIDGHADDGAAITTALHDSFGVMGTANRKRFSRVRGMFHRDGQASAHMTLLTDYAKPSVGLWLAEAQALGHDTSVGILERWRGINGVGSRAALAMSTLTNGPLTFIGAEYAFQAGGVL
jgi:hypothetical protein